MRVLGWLTVAVVLPLFALAQSLDDGVASFNKGRFGEAKSIFEALLKQNDKNAEAHYRLGMVLLTRQYRNEDDAVDHMEQAVEINPSNAEYQYGLGSAYGMKAQNSGVIKQVFLAPKVKRAFERAVALDPKLVDAHIGLAQYYWRAPGIMGGDMEKAWKEADRAIELDEFKGRLLKANICVSEKKTAEAAQEMKTLTAHRSDDWRAWRTAGYFFWRNQMTDDAIASFEKYAGLKPDTGDAYHFLARAYIQKKDAGKAVPAAMKALALGPDNINAIDVLAQAYELSGQKKEARENYERLLTMDVTPEYKKNLEKKIKELQ